MAKIASRIFNDTLSMAEDVKKRLREVQELSAGIYDSVNAEDSDKTSYRLPTLSLSRYIFNNFSVGINYSENDINVSNEDLYYYSLEFYLKLIFLISLRLNHLIFLNILVKTIFYSNTFQFHLF